MTRKADVHGVSDYARLDFMSFLGYLLRPNSTIGGLLGTGVVSEMFDI